MDSWSLTKHNTSTKISVFVLFALIFMLNPLCGTFLCAYWIMSSNDNIPSWAYHIFFILIACWLGCINITKMPTGDLPGYIRHFERVPVVGFYTTVFGSFGGSGKEPLYNIITYVGYYVCFGKAFIYFFLLTVAAYYLLFSATYKIFKAAGASKAELMCGVISFAFFTQYFVLTTHLVRQILSMSVMMYAISDGIVKGKHNWLLAIASILIHTSSLLPFLFSLVKWIYSKLSVTRFLLLLAFLILVTVFNSQIGSILIGSNLPTGALQYAASRYASNSGDGLYVPVSLMMMVYGPMLVVSVRLLWTLRHGGNSPLYPIAYMCIFFMLFVLAFYQNPLTQYRYFYYTYALIPFIVPLMFYQKRNGNSRAYCTVVSAFFIAYFFVIHNTSGFQYADRATICFMPFPYYFLNPAF